MSLTSRTGRTAAKRSRSRSIASRPQHPAAAPFERAKLEACRWLARAPRSAAEIARRLTARGFTAATIAAALQALQDVRYIDDAELARRRAEELMLRRLCGRERVVDELTRRGLADSVIASAIASVMVDCTDVKLVRRALRRKFRAPALAPAERTRAFRFLVTRGHPAEIVSEVLEDEGAAAYDEDEGQTISKGE